MTDAELAVRVRAVLKLEPYARETVVALVALLREAQEALTAARRKVPWTPFMLEFIEDVEARLRTVLGGRTMSDKCRFDSVHKGCLTHGNTYDLRLVPLPAPALCTHAVAALRKGLQVLADDKCRHFYDRAVAAETRVVDLLAENGHLRAKLEGKQ